MGNPRGWLIPIVLLCAALVTGRARAECAGDCDDDGTVTVRELLIGVNIVLGKLPLSDCSRFDGDSDGTVSVSDLVKSIENALTACGTIPTVTPTPTSTPGTPSPTVVAPRAVAGITSRTTVSLLQLPRAIGAVAVAAEAYALAGAPPAPALVSCPLGGFVHTQAGDTTTLVFGGCSIPTANGRVAMSGTAQVLPTFLSIDVNLDFRDPAENLLLSSAVNVGGSGTPSFGGPCLLTGVTFQARGSIGVRDPAGHTGTLAFFRTNTTLTISRFDQYCMPERFRIVTRGLSDLYPATAAIGVQAVDFSLDVDATENPARVTVGGGFESACLGGSVQLQSPLVPEFPWGALCAVSGEIDAGTPRFVYRAGGAIDFDADGNGLPEPPRAAHCFDAGLVTCP